MGKLCQYCNKREAKIHFTEIKDGKQTEMHICEHCAHEKNLAMAFPSLLSHIVKGGPPGLGTADSDAVPATCPGCGLGYADFKSKGRLGCSTCYDSFAPVLVALLEKVHGASRHSGRAPENEPEEMEPVDVSPESEIDAFADDSLDKVEESLSEEDALRAELEQAIASEQYEKAAELRDKIRALKEADGES